jgi:outer membrane lipoprotein-sorting protein
LIATLKLTAAASAILATAGLSYLATAPRAGAAVTFAEVAKRLQDAHTLSYRFSTSVPGQAGPTTGREYFKDPGLFRTESEGPQAAVNVFDSVRGKVLSLDPAAKVAILQDLKLSDEQRRRWQAQASDTATHLRSLAGKEGKPAGRRKIGDVEAEGFRVEDGEIAWTVWVDAGRKLPLLMETTFRLEGRDLPATLSDFRIDPPLDDALFRLEPPAGYALRAVDVPVGSSGEAALIDLLRLCAEASGGAFPPKILDREAMRARFPKEKWTGPDDPRMIRLAQATAASVVFLQFALKEAYGYAPDGVRLGDAGRILFWYRPKGSPTYRAIFGDLHAEDVAADRLPEKPKF